ncbi:MAG: DUF2225 domain-containing protein [Defluviitaleaceae bacterium]|nr:DUF2225 domain-containing protein [Defluviitaleaceae bacterium]
MKNIELLNNIGKITKFEKNQVIFMQNDAGDHMYIALAGAYGVYINSFTDFPMRVALIQVGKVFGEMEVIDGGTPRAATIIAEEDGIALFIDKDNFGLLLENSPELATGILKTMYERAADTSETVRSAGKAVPELPAQLKGARPDNAKQMHNSMILLSQYIRELNTLLAAAEAVPASTPTKQHQKGLITLLPAGYRPLMMNDPNDNSNLLTRKTTICPYCGGQSEAFIPLYSRLVQKEVTLDQRIIYENLKYLWYTNVVCPVCNYTDSYQEFTKGGKEDASRYNGDRFENTEGFTGFARTHSRSLDEVITSYYLNIECLKRTSGDPLRLGKAWLRLYWIYGDHNVENFKQQSAYEALVEYRAYMKQRGERLGVEDQMRINAILGELSASVEDYAMAEEYFKKNTVIGRKLNNDLVKQSIKRYRELKDA